MRWYLQSSKKGKVITLKFYQSISQAGALMIPSLEFPLRLQRELLEANSRIKQFCWGLIIADFVKANTWNSIPFPDNLVL